MHHATRLMLIAAAGSAASLVVAQTREAATEPAAATVPATVSSTMPSTAPQTNRDSDRRDNSRRDGRRDDAQRAGTSSAPASAARPAPPANEYADRFAVIGDMNMFMRDRVRRVARPTNDSGTRAPTPRPSPESVLVLRGVVLEEGLFRAYFEDTQANQIVQVTAGDVLARGHVAEISMDAVAFENNGALIWVKVGDNLVGTRVAAAPGATTTPSASGTAPAGAAGTPAGAADPNTLSAEERMRQRRAQRGGK